MNLIVIGNRDFLRIINISNNIGLSYNIIYINHSRTHDDYFQHLHILTQCSGSLKGNEH